jgi:hypothetical protein
MTEQPLESVSPGAAAVDAGITAKEAEPADREVPIPRSPHLERLKSSKGGPYYLAPDSAEPLPPGMWSGLDPAAVENEMRALNERGSQGDAEALSGLPSEQRDFLEAGGPAALKLLETLSRGLEATSRELLVALEEQSHRDA